MTFDELGLSKPILRAVSALGYNTPTPVQAQAIPLVLAGADVVAAAQTGTGKTAAFTLPLMQRIGRGKGVPLALVVTPTRELAVQIERVAAIIAKETDQRVTVAVGGVKYRPQANRIKSGIDLLVATPGRLIDLVEHGNVSLASVQALVLDEADRMLDMGFWPSMRRILGFLPDVRQTLLFSATLDEAITQLIDGVLHDPVYVEIARQGTTVEQLEQAVLPVEQSQKPELLAALVRQRGADRVLVFTKMKNRADFVKTILDRDGLRVTCIHANRSQQQRERALSRFRSGRIDILVATDIIARGIDISDIDHVINYDVPENPEDYVHRIGRTARAGASGYAFTLLGPDELTQFREIEYFLGQQVPVLDIEDFPYREGRIIPFAGRPVKKRSHSVYGGSITRRGRRR
ncbi:MAG: DEAD/DEAH box helicase [Coriobacteriia bacterium]|nr:DEAD/DEAH box helicase [Coriobacteriia bacterium]